MASSHTCALFILMLLTISSTGISDDWIEATTALRMEKTTHLRFYFQDRLSGKDPTAVQIIGKGIGFGTTFMIDDALTRRPERNSEVVGRAQGIYSLATQNDVGLLMVLVISFTQGKYNGSSLSMLGRNHVFDDVREMPIVGGSGLFRLARGYALLHSIWFDQNNTGDATVEYNVSVIHY